MSPARDDAASAEVAIFGPYPPPWGGMGVHVKRLAPLLGRAGVTWRIYNGLGQFADPPRIVNVARRPRRQAAASLLFCRHRVCYVVTTRTIVRFWAGLMGLRGRRVILRVGGTSLADSLRLGGFRERWMTRVALRRVWGVVAVNEEIARVSAEVRGSPRHIWVIPGFLRPPAEPDLPAGPATEAFLATHSPLLLAMGRFTRLHDREVYGAADLTELLHRVRRKFPRAGVLFVLTQPRDLDGPVWADLKRRIEQLALAEHFRVQPAAGELVPLMRRADLLVRPTSTDGDANSVREALWVGLPVVASDCVPRPEGTVLHRTGDADDLAARTLSTLEGLEQARARVAALSVGDSWPALRDVFSAALERPLSVQPTPGLVPGSAGVPWTDGKA